MTIFAGAFSAWVMLLVAGQASPAERFALAGAIEQGGLVFGRAGAATKVSLGKRTLRLTGDGRFIFGIHRDEKGPLILRLQYRDGGKEERRLAVSRRAWRIQRITGLPRALVTPPKHLMARLTREYYLVRAARKTDSAATHWGGRLDWPAQGRVSGVFGSQRFYNGKARSFHSGVDIAKPRGAAIKAPTGGTVTLVHQGMYFAGKIVVLDHGHGLASTFIHLSKTLVEVGDRVTKGQTVGLVGATGRATGPHLHWSLSWFQTRIDPVRAVGPMPRQKPRKPSKRATSKPR
ncbi:MAG: M23 family metallopeptidase [Alphaproteobacteria bacterium]